MTTTLMAPCATVDRILLIEDDPNHGMLLQRWLELDGQANVTWVVTGPEGLAHLNSGVRWSLVVTDVLLPGVDGLQLVGASKEVDSHTPVLLITGQESLDVAMRALELRADACLFKPFSRNTFVEKAEQLLAQCKAKQDALKRRVLAIGAHPDDVELGCGGALLQHRADGDDVMILTLSRGSAGGEVRKRVREAELAASRLGASLQLANLPDTSISEGSDTISLIEHVVGEFEPDIVYTHSLHDRHQDHRNTYQATTVATRNVTEIYSYQSPSSTVDFRPSLFIDIVKFFEEKIAVLSAYQSQVAKCPYLDTDAVASAAKYWSRFTNLQLVEPLEVVRGLK